MARMSYLRLQSPDGLTKEAEAYSTDDKRQLLPPGTWRIRDMTEGGDGTTKVMAIEDMPEHWVKQFAFWGEFGQRL